MYLDPVKDEEKLILQICEENYTYEEVSVQELKHDLQNHIRIKL